MKKSPSLLAGSLIAATLGLSSVHAALPTDPEFNIHRGQIPLVDDLGREVILQGLNSGSGKHAEMRRAWEQADDVAHQAVNLGYNTHRFLIFWDHIMPERGVINHEYLDDVERRLQWFADNDMHVILDMHQDNWGQQCAGNGAPAWASIGTAEPAPGAPWWIIAASPCVVDSVNNFFRNNGDIQAEFAKAWVAVADRFKDHPAVFGYDLMNEPTQIDGIADQMVMEMLSKEDTTLLNTASLTTVWVNGKPQNAFSGILKDKIRQMVASQNLVVPDSYVNKITEVLISRNKGDWGSLNAVKEFEAGMLSGLYQRVINSIRQVDNDTYIFVEPMSISVNNGSPTYLRRLDDPRNGDRRLGYIPHMYPRELHEGGAYHERDFIPMDNWERNQRKFVYDNNMAWVLGEFGHSNRAEGGVQFLEDAVRMLERNKLGWEYWDSHPGGWGPIAGDKVSDQPNAFALVNIYPRAISGRVESYNFDRDNLTFTLSYRNHKDATGSTEIAIPPRFFPNGFVVSSSDEDGKWSQHFDAQRNILHVYHDQEAYQHTITVKANSDSKQLVFRNLINNGTGMCVDFPGKLPHSGDQTISWKCNDKSWQRWAFDAGQIRNYQNADYCLSHGGPAQAVDGGAITVELCNGSDDQQWLLDGNVVRNVYNTNIVMDAFGDTNSAQIGQWSYHGGDNQRWHWAWQDIDHSMHAMLNKMQKSERYNLVLETTDGDCAMQWDGTVNRRNERNAEWDCWERGDGLSFVASTDPVEHASGAISIDGHFYTRDGQCGLEWDGHLDGNNERNAKWDCSGSADEMTLVANGTSGSMVVRTKVHGCGLEFHSAGGRNGEHNAKFDCTPRYDEVKIRQMNPAQFIEPLAKVHEDKIGSRWLSFAQNMRQISVADDGSSWATGHDDTIYRLVNDEWQVVPGKLRHVSVGAAGLVWGINAAQNIYRWNGNSWTQVSGQLVHIEVAANGEVWGINRADNVYRRGTDRWLQQPGLLRQLDVAANGEVWGVNAEGNLYQFNGSGWNQQATHKSRVALASDGAIWTLGQNGEVSRLVNGEYLALEGKFKHLSAATGTLIGTDGYGVSWQRQF